MASLLLPAVLLCGAHPSVNDAGNCTQHASQSTLLRPLLAPLCRCSAQLAFGEGSAVLKEGRNATIQGLSGTGSLRVGAGSLAAPWLRLLRWGRQRQCGQPWLFTLPLSGSSQCEAHTLAVLQPHNAGGRRVPLSLLHPQVRLWVV